MHFDLISLNETGATHHNASTARKDCSLESVGSGAVVNPKDGNALLVDDDGTGYIAYTAMKPTGDQPAPGNYPAGFKGDHRVAIERLTHDLQHSTKVQIGHLFPDDFVEGAMVFKRRDAYCIIYSSCSCAGRGGSGVVVHTATNVNGPWTRQTRDAPICAAPGFPKEGRPLDITVRAQGLELSVMAGEYIWQGERWLSVPHYPSNCSSLCLDPIGDCEQPKNYVKDYDYSYWIPLQFDKDGAVEQFEPFVDDWKIDLDPTR